jgi:hypothetical protein
LRGYAEAIAELNKALPFSHRFAAEMIWLQGYNFALWGKRNEAIKKLDELEKLSERPGGQAYGRSVIYTGLQSKLR